MKKLAKALGYIIGVILTLLVILGLFDIALGLLELAWWMITGDFFHLIDIEPPSIF